jgi:uncharacterized OB-fold protein
VSAPRIRIEATGPERVFWEGAEREELLLQRCDACERSWHPPAQRCPHCGSAAYTWVPASGAGAVYSLTTVHHAAHPAVADLVPYTILLVDLAEGPRIASRLIAGCETSVGDPVAVRFDRTSGIVLPLFGPVS